MPPLARVLVRLALLAAAFALATRAFGWWAVPVLAAAWGAARSWDDRRALIHQGPTEPLFNQGPTEAALAALVAWGALLAAAAAGGPVGAVAEWLAGIMRVPAAVPILLTLLLPPLLAWSAAAAARGLTLTLVGGSRST